MKHISGFFGKGDISRKVKERVIFCQFQSNYAQTSQKKLLDFEKSQIVTPPFNKKIRIIIRR